MMIKKIGSLLIKRRTSITFLIVFILLTRVFLEKRVPFSIFDFHALWGSAGAFIVLLGVLLRSWSAGVLHKSEILARQGPYAIIRHPLYMGSLLIGLGFCMITGDLVNIITILVLAIVLYIPKKIYEEKKLSEKFGTQWVAYTSEVPAFIPYKIPSPSTVFSGFSLERWRHNHEYEAALVCMSFLIILQIYLSVYLKT
jgi:protein-S-isoprenylcysteine O-methyltransferase Ste14